ncbi:hypothetical protein LB465_14070 [Salegentibacter sp. LM13S]|uniref:LEM-3-like GIY-YIG domain-containing protein n=1 Tax=Salegentibacter lacus TaxID=2873599 RepID=UPI001CCD4DF1|nr:hypothetical protein [Salegentibacter lacus]MBZ9631911.1 hypothetical protein [Salegentibacter lacus]
MSNNRYYVYGLIDPRDNQIFYIGKGTGKRYSSHLKKNRLDFNSGKIDQIIEIQNSGLEVKIEILFQNLDEETAYDLEKVIIYKLGRKVFSEGTLTNLIPGGRWKTGDPIFYDNSYTPAFDSNRLGLFGENEFLRIKTKSTFDYLNTNKERQIVYRYNWDGSFDKEKTLNELFIEGVREVEMNILKFLRIENLPIYGRGIHSKFFYENIYISEKIPTCDYDIIDQDFHKEFDLKFGMEEDFTIHSYENDILRLELCKNKTTIDYQSYYITGQKKSFRRTKYGRPYELALEWFENGNLSVKEELIDGYSEYIRTTYYESGEKYIRISRGKGKKEYDRWFKNGKKEVEFIDNGYNYYNESGELVKIIKPE